MIYCTVRPLTSAAAVWGAKRELGLGEFSPSASLLECKTARRSRSQRSADNFVRANPSHAAQLAEKAVRASGESSRRTRTLTNTRVAPLHGKSRSLLPRRHRQHRLRIIRHAEGLHEPVVVELDRPGADINSKHFDFTQALAFAQNARHYLGRHAWSGWHLHFEQHLTARESIRHSLQYDSRWLGGRRILGPCVNFLIQAESVPAHNGPGVGIFLRRGGGRRDVQAQEEPRHYSEQELLVLAHDANSHAVANTATQVEFRAEMRKGSDGSLPLKTEVVVAGWTNSTAGPPHPWWTC